MYEHIFTKLEKIREPASSLRTEVVQWQAAF